MDKHNHIYGTKGCLQCDIEAGRIKPEDRPIEPLKEGEHTNNEDLKKKLNEVIKRLNSMQ